MLLEQYQELKHHCRSPHGERGLKLKKVHYQPGAIKSLPARGAWIEIQLYRKPYIRQIRRSPHGERGLKCIIVSTF